MRHIGIRCCVLVALCLPATVIADEPEIDHLLSDVVAIGHEGRNGVTAAAATRRLGDLSPQAVLPILKAFSQANPLAANLLRSAVETIADRSAASDEALPSDLLAEFAVAQQHDPRARRLAYELVARVEPATARELIPGLLTDANPEFRRDAVAYWIENAKALARQGRPDAAKQSWHKALSGAIHDDQVRTITTALEGFGETIDVQKHFGFVAHWKVIGPFDNTGMKGFDAVYPPEEETFDETATYAGKLGGVSWQPISTDDPYGVIDIAMQLENYKGSAMYFACRFESEHDQTVEIRLGTANAWKLWVNGEFKFGRQEYHRGMELDQYRVPVSLKAGANVILFKILQNEQDEDWAQSYKFRLRVCDATGVAVLPAEPDGRNRRP